MYEIEVNEISEDFYPCWRAAAIHLGKQVDGGIKSWLRAHPYPPFLEHLSFRLGNQLFFIRVIDIEGKIIGPGNHQGHETAAKLASGHACLLPMKKRFLGGAWETAASGWGLLDAQTRAPIYPLALITDEKIKMSDWELQDMAVQVVRDQISKDGYELMSWQGNPEVNPSIWFVGGSGGPEWVVVRAVRYPEKSAQRPNNWTAISTGCTKISSLGHFASVAIVSKEQQFASKDEPEVPLWRGHAMRVRFTGLE